MVKPEEQFIISKVISLGICDFLDKRINNVLIKWPNDIYVNDDKIAGILIENSIIQNEIKNVVAGIGLNINQVKFNSNTPNPVSLSLLTGMNYDLDECLTGLAANLDKRYKQLLNDNRSQIDNDYISHLYRFNKWSTFKDVNGIFKGRIVTVTDTGCLQVQTRNSAVHEYMFKEVDFI
jgi:BirA family biotin operon repressor/biotin-[acetyl-CoA-carboxylase] ligase